MIETLKVCKNVLKRLKKTDSENEGKYFKEKLIFPIDRDNEKRISEQELRFLFIEEFKNNSNLFYSVETPTKDKYKFGSSLRDIKIDKNGQSASIDLTIFDKKNNGYKRVLNVEFKYSNVKISKIAKDILKLVNEKENGAFILLLKNTNKGTLCNKRKSGVLDKIYKSFEEYKEYWKDNKYVDIAILSLEEKNNKAFIIYRKIIKKDLSKLNEIFNMDNLNKNWQKIEIKE